MAAVNTAYFHLPGLFEFYELYRVFLPLFREHREYFFDWCEIGSIYGAPGAAAAPGSERLRRAMCSRSCRNTASPRV